MRERRVYTLKPNGVPQPYSSWISERNGVGAGLIADILGVEFGGERRGRVDDGRGYFVPPKPIDKLKSKKLGIMSSEDLYGGAMEYLLQADKAVLHVLARSEDEKRAPRGYSSALAKHLLNNNLVLPGYTAFTQRGAMKGFEKLQNEGHEVRIKDPNASDGGGQFRVKDEIELKAVLEKYDDRYLNEVGLVTEADLRGSVLTVSPGVTVLNGQVFGHLSFQKDILGEDGSFAGYGGAETVVVRGGFVGLHQRFAGEPEIQKAVSVASETLNILSYFDPVLSRASFDVVSGENSRGEQMSGVTDLTFRFGGSSPGELLAIRELMNNPQLNEARAETVLDYELREPDPEAVTFIDHQKLRVQAKIVDMV